MAEGSEKMNKVKVLATFLVPFLAIMLVWNVIAPEWREIPASISVDNTTIGFDVNTTSLTFGRVFMTGTSQREMLISNMDDYDKVARFTVEGDIAKFVTVPPEMIARANANTSVGMTAIVPFGTPLGNYTGKVVVFLRRAI